MRIDKISIDHFRCFEHKEISFHPQFNVIIGENGLGKTAVVDAIAYLLNPYRHGLASNGLLEIKQKDIRRVRFGRTEEVSEKDTVLAIEIKDFFTDNERHDIAWTLQQNINVSYFYDSQYQEAQNKVRNIILPKGVSMLKKYPIIAYYPANRIAPQTSKIAAEQIAPNGSRFDAYNKALENNPIDIQLITARIKTLDYAIYTKSKYTNDDPSLIGIRAELDAIKQAITHCIPNCKTIDFHSDWNELMIDFGNNDIKPFSFLSDGFRNMLAIVADIAHRCARLNPNLNEDILTETEGIVLIDEIDLHLHPNWQRTIVGNLKRTFPKIQFIVTTHSPFIVQSLKKEELINLQEPVEGLETDLYNLGLEDAAEVMNVEGMPKGIRFMEMVATAEKYYDLIASGENGKTKEEIVKLGNKLNELEAIYSDDSAFVALLRAERKVKKL